MTPIADAADFIESWRSAPSSSIHSVDPSRLLEVIEILRDVAGVDLHRSITLCESAVQLADSIDSAECRARSRSVLAHALNYANEFDRAIDILTEAGEIAESAGSLFELARVLLVRVHSLARSGNLRQAMECGMRSERLFHDLNQPTWRSRALTNTAIVTRMLGDPETAAEMFQCALEVPGNDRSTVAQIRNCLAEAKLDMGDFRGAESEFQTAVGMLRSSGASRLAAILRGNLADLYGKQGRLALAIAEFEQSRSFFESDNAPGDLGRILSEEAEVLASLGEVALAATLAERAVPLLERAGLATEHARTLRVLGTLVASTHPQRARAILREASSISQAGDQLHDHGRALLALGRLEIGQQDFVAASELIDQARKHVESFALDELDADLASCELSLRAGRLSEAEQLVERAFDQARTLRVPTLIGSALALRAKCRESRGGLTESIVDHISAVRAIEQLRGSLATGMLRSAWQGRCTRVYDAAAAALVRAGDIDSAFDICERRSGRVLLDLQGVSPVWSDSVTTSDRAVEELREAQFAVKASYAGFDGALTGTGRDKWLANVAEAEERVRQAQLRVDSDANASLGPDGLVRLSELRLHLDASDRVVSFLSDDDRMWALLIDANEARAIELPRSLEELRGIVGAMMFQVRRAIARGPSFAGRSRAESFVDAARAAFDVLMRPLELSRQVERLFVVVPRELETIPWSALHDGKLFSCQWVTCHRLPQASILPLLGERRSAATAQAAVFGCDDANAIDMVREAQCVGGLIPSSRVVLGTAATVDGFREAVLGAGHVHLACHGVFPRGNPLAAAVKLADGWVTVRELMSWRLSGCRVVLSGCDTGRSESMHAADPLGMVTGLLAAGARGVIASLWPAHDRLARDLMEELYTEASGDLERADLSKCLSNAQESLLKAGTHPAFWAQWAYTGV